VSRRIAADGAVPDLDTIFVIHEDRDMATRNVTVSLDEDVALWARLEAARRDTSVSRLLGGILKERMARESQYDQAMQSALARRPFLASDGRYLSREQVHDRARLR
jgi:hypothetical protein